ncbi:MAG: hypothetical protein KDK91_32850, partial [Gammaproteobacteria bacterium]|nr:hypothetical protein [Gammaproteobacteria bacterium]
FGHTPLARTERVIEIVVVRVFAADPGACDLHEVIRAVREHRESKPTALPATWISEADLQSLGIRHP